MKAFHQAMMGIIVVAALIVAFGLVQPAMVSAWAQQVHGAATRGHEAAVGHTRHAAAQDGHAAAAQHGDMGDPAAHFRAVAEHLGLTAEQQQVLAEPFSEAFAAMQRLHELHEVIAAELTDEQKAAFADMVHEMMDGGFGGALGGQ